MAADRQHGADSDRRPEGRGAAGRRCTASRSWRAVSRAPRAHPRAARRAHEPPGSRRSSSRRCTSARSSTSAASSTASRAIHCLEGDEATELADGLEPRPDEYLIRKRRYSAFFATELELVLQLLRRRDALILVGALTDVCVHYTFADAHQHDYRCRVVTDCVGRLLPGGARRRRWRRCATCSATASSTSDEVLERLAGQPPGARRCARCAA